MSKTKLSKNAFRRQQKKLKKEVSFRALQAKRYLADDDGQESPAPAEPAVSELAAQPEWSEDGANPQPAAAASTGAPAVAAPGVDVDGHVNVDDNEFDFGNLPEFSKVFQRFREPQEDTGVKHQEKEQVLWEEDNDNIPDEEAEQAAPRKSKKQRKRENKLSVAELKAMARKPEMVEWTDADSSDPRLLLSIKSHRNVVPVPAHWSLKREVSSVFRSFVLDLRITLLTPSTAVSVLEKRHRETCFPLA
jgi:splicing factor 3B subunit 2